MKQENHYKSKLKEQKHELEELKIKLKYADNKNILKDEHY